MINLKQVIQSSLLFLVIILIQLKLSFAYTAFGVKPDLLIILLIRFSIKYPNPKTAVSAGFLTGMFNDLLIGDVIGISSLTYSIVCFAAAYLKRGNSFVPSEKRFLLYFSSISFSTILIYLVTLSGLDLIYNLSHIILPSILYTLTISLFFQIFKPVK